ncbi:MAG: metal ABC transporter ATP-binding protein [Archaeoglobaceae archaeon]|nr:metal ABC transporter ATP-binding protein [Archaeoglobaceae archaeon]MCX8151610.1 metal ABC transporter ATP-binding protein [Archaeoglobaceae archaeon]MDW8013112.1 metal ABC transporter ATP-binding protein [Archaeoglobaceae archaeon]
MIKVEDLCFRYKEIVLEDVSFEVERGEFVAILGPNGAGKSTLLKLIAGILKPYRGKIELKTKRIAYLPQKERINPEIPLKVREVFEFTAKALGVKDFEKFIKLAEVNENLLFRELSGGMQQRVLVARLLMSDPEIILLDEPFNGIDLKTQSKIVEILRNLSFEGRTVVVVVHNVNPILHEVDRVMLLNRRVVAFGKPEEVFSKDENIIKTYGEKIPLAICEKGFKHPLYA